MVWVAAAEVSRDYAFVRGASLADTVVGCSNCQIHGLLIAACDQSGRSLSEPRGEGLRGLQVARHRGRCPLRLFADDSQGARTSRVEACVPFFGEPWRQLGFVYVLRERVAYLSRLGLLPVEVLHGLRESLVLGLVNRGSICCLLLPRLLRRWLNEARGFADASASRTPLCRACIPDLSCRVDAGAHRCLRAVLPRRLF